MGEMLISTEGLDELLTQGGAGGQADRSGLVLLDARPTLAYLFGHIPGAVNAGWKEFSDPASPLKSLLDSNLDRLEKKVGDLGVSSDHRVIVYGDPFECNGEEGRIYWMLSYLGHPSVQILNGGWFKWKREGRRIERGPGKNRPARFKANVNSELLMVKEDLSQRVHSLPANMVVVDARSREEYLGLERSGLPREGHIPGAVNIPWNSFFNADGTVRSTEEIRNRVGENRLTTDQEVVTYCTGGVRSAWLYFALRLAGFGKVKNYAGSWMEWSRDLDLPIER